MLVAFRHPYSSAALVIVVLVIMASLICWVVRALKSSSASRLPQQQVPLRGVDGRVGRKNSLMTTANNLTIYGFPEECKRFEQRHPLWQEMMDNLVRALNLAFTREFTAKGPEDKLVYFFGKICLEDFMEISLVSYHGYGFAASKLVRSMYEYAVTLHYLHDHPEEVKIFLEYHLVQQDKLISRLIETFGDSILPVEAIANARR